MAYSVLVQPPKISGFVARTVTLYKYAQKCKIDEANLPGFYQILMAKYPTMRTHKERSSNTLYLFKKTNEYGFDRQ